MAHASCAVTKDQIWSASEKLSPRVKRLRDEYFDFYGRPYFQNEVMPFTTGTEWDDVFPFHHFAVVPDVYPFLPCFADSLLACAKKVDLPEGFFDMSLAKRRATFLKIIAEKYLPVHILEGELIVGGQFNTALSRSHSKTEAKKVKKLNDAWWKRAKRANELGLGNSGVTPGHLIPNYKKVLRKGFKGLTEDYKAEIAGTKDKAKIDYLEAMIIAAEVPRILSERYARYAEQEAAKAKDRGRKEELLEIARIARKVPWEPAGSFHEALQSLWMTHMLVMTDESYPGPGLSPGRIDQYLYPFYQKDIDSKKITRDWAKELLDCYWVKNNYVYDFQGHIGENQGISAGFGQLITLGGINEKGEDASNDLTWLMMEVIEEMNTLEPKPNIRIHAKTPDKLLRRIAELVIETQGSPFLINFDENSMRALKWQGLPEDKLWDYAPVGCLENTLQGNDRSGTVDVNMNIAKAVELTLNNGKDMKTGQRVGPRTGDPRTFKNFDQFMAAFKKQLSALLKELIEIYNISDESRATYQPTVYLSTLVDGCEKKGRDVNNSGAEHNYITVEGIALATAADSLIAVKKLVYEDKRISMDELLTAIGDNFEGHEKLRQTLINKAPKYGNDDDYADSIAKEISQYWSTEATGYTSPATGRKYRAGYLSWNYWIAYAPSTAATPDGRKRGTYLSNGVCPVNGADTRGPTAVTMSVGKLGLETIPNGDSHTISFSPSLVKDKERLEKLMSFLRTYNEKGGTALQINVIDSDTLKAAQENPDDFKNLIVRVTGYNAYFVSIGREIQDEIIARVAKEL
jgi:pyruvate formate-lyase/glycerol dehydratase family glycyl radical enzyme